MSANIDPRGRVTRLESRALAEPNLTERDVVDAPKLVRLFAILIRELAALKRRWAPPRIDFEDVVVGSAGERYRFPHGLNGRVRWMVVDWEGGGSLYNLARSADTDANTLVLESYMSGTMTLRIERAG